MKSYPLGELVRGSRIIKFAKKKSHRQLRIGKCLGNQKEMRTDGLPKF